MKNDVMEIVLDSENVMQDLTALIEVFLRNQMAIAITPVIGECDCAIRVSAAPSNLSQTACDSPSLYWLREDAARMVENAYYDGDELHCSSCGKSLGFQEVSYCPHCGDYLGAMRA